MSVFSRYDLEDTDDHRILHLLCLLQHLCEHLGAQIVVSRFNCVTPESFICINAPIDVVFDVFGLRCNSNGLGENEFKMVLSVTTEGALSCHFKASDANN